MSEPGDPVMTLQLRAGVVTGVNVGPPGTVTVNIGGDTATTTDLPFIDGYDPVIADVVQILTDAGSALVLGRTAYGVSRVWSQNTSSTGGFTTAQVDLVVAGAIQSSGIYNFKIEFSFDSWSSTVVNDRLGLRIRRSVNGGAFTDVARMLPRVTVASNSEGGGTLMVVDQASTPGSYVYKATAVREAGTGTLVVNAAVGQPMTLTIETI